MTRQEELDAIEQAINAGRVHRIELDKAEAHDEDLRRRPWDEAMRAMIDAEFRRSRRPR